MDRVISTGSNIQKGIDKVLEFGTHEQLVLLIKQLDEEYTDELMVFGLLLRDLSEYMHGVKKYVDVLLATREALGLDYGQLRNKFLKAKKHKDKKLLEALEMITEDV